ncbi:hypothetical protein Pcinc_042140 [Petrolisthes cinctipes]|uniref:Uncharacterized protein n=1 Tax=Petrolisthes cinctipes TaxID=88211 RepID=A0AAE1BL77_PETCI|nr:hypothetical protein Pcinc_042140 [Petrolisthes cinctipes]
MACVDSILRTSAAYRTFSSNLQLLCVTCLEIPITCTINSDIEYDVYYNLPFTTSASFTLTVRSTYINDKLK